MKRPGWDRHRSRATAVKAVLAGAWAATSGVACGDNLPFRDPIHPVPGCEAVEHAPCDVRTPACQQQLFAVAACLRAGAGAAGGPPPVTVMTEDDFAAYLAARNAMSPPSAARENITQQWDWALSTLGLIEPGALSPSAMMMEDVTFIAGLYRPDTKDVLVVDHGGAFDRLSGSIVLVHEMVHALQDREIDLGQFFSGHVHSTDSALAVRSMIEGEARFHETRYMAAVLGLDPATIDWMKRFESTLVLDQSRLLMEPSPFTATSRMFPYEWGARYIYLTWTGAGQEGVRARYTAPPETTRALMASMDRAVDAEAAPETLAGPTPPADWATIDSGTLGAWTLFLLLADLGTPDQARILALHWRADGFWLYQGPGSPSPLATRALVWRIELGDDTTASEVVRALAFRTGSYVRQVGSTVHLVATSTFTPPDWAFGN